MKLLQSKLTGWSLGMILPRRAVPNQQYMHLHGVRLVRFDCLVCLVGTLGLRTDQQLFRVLAGHPGFHICL